MKPKILHSSLTELSEDLLYTDTPAYVQKHKKTLNVDYKHCDFIKIVNVIHEKHNKTTKTAVLLLKKFNFE